MTRTARSGGAGKTAKTRPVRPSARKYVGWRVLLNPLWCYWGFMASVIVVTVFGLLMVFSSSTVDVISSRKSPWAELRDQAIFCAIGVAFALFTMHVPERLYRRLAIYIVGGAWVLQGLTMTGLGQGAYGNNGWISVGGVSFQPAEFLKLALCVWLPAGMLAAQRKMRTEVWWKAYSGVFLVTFVSFALVMLGKDLGTGMIVALICAFAFLVGGFPLKLLGIFSVVGGAAVLGLFVFGSGNRMSRIMATYGTCSADDAQSVCFQSIHGNFAMGSGGLFGVGLGNSREKWNYLPAAHNDFIFAIIGEELGFVGAALLILGFVVMGWCMVGVALQCKDPYARMVIVCVGAWIVGQALINIAVVLGLLPVMGLPMPFVSAGGSALVMCLGASGVVVQMMRQQGDIRAALVRE
ncbi:cell division protein FtsW [Bifidobacterium sp. DSM 109958]|uniref:Probable peptidoglycan glycosyltransferase FtsW n=1 Tax=Bifidobacterium moraviense TaxID=2675323 RepID=A0A7Y0HZY8_9BIFI|nr:putative peptidoglycan glycosyltransferase FtsW [Bifidobacterium sp. DSM 109958]NMN00893.1 cell division protein FtsW [Bifidobacterium sp. DSM 109958]